MLPIPAPPLRWLASSFVLCGLSLLATWPLAAQQQGARAGRDSALVRLETLVVTADRTALPIATSTHAISVLTRATIEASPARNIAQAIQQEAGLTFVDFDGSGEDPQLMVRGFYGGGEAEYALLLVDGRPLNALESGRIAWDAIPLAAIERIEIVRGPASAAWGDAALGAVINVITRSAGARGGRIAFSGGSFGRLDGSVHGTHELGGRNVTYFGSATDLDGFRDHAERTSGSIGASYAVNDETTISTVHDWRDFDTPGPLTAAELVQDRAASSAFYRFDGTRDRRHQLHIDRAWSAGSARWSIGLAGEYRHEDRTRTVALAPTFADSKDRVLGASRLIATAQTEWSSVLATADELLLGIDLSGGRLRSTYYDLVTGPAVIYAGASGSRGDVHADGSGTRIAAAAFIGYNLPLAPALRLSVGARADWLRDRYSADAPEPNTVDARHTAFSPRAGLNLRYAEGPQHTGHLWLSVSRSFKAPTLDQLFDQRRFPVPFPPFELGFANTDLDPQYGRSIEAGLYHAIAIVPGITTRVSLAAYQMDLRDELDFDIETLSYQNLSRSRHRGVETGLDVDAGSVITAWARLTRQSAFTREGAHEGNQLKAIPRNLFTTGMRARADWGLSASLMASSVWGAPIDDANTIVLPGWTRWDARLGLELSAFSVWINSANLFDADYSTTAYPDAADPETIYYFPAAGRTLELGISRAW